MTIDKCPTCKRKFNGIADYPIVCIQKFERVEMPTDLVFPWFDWSVFVGPDSEAGNARPPQDVLSFFRDNKIAETFEHDGLEWQKQGKWNTGNYHRTQKDQRQIILGHVNPYLNHLDSLVGKEIPTSQVLPNFQRDRYFGFTFGIPNTGYNLAIENEKGNTLRSAEIVILGQGPNLGSAGGPTLQQLAVVGKIKYEGRLRR